jgi:hypothetical protein
MENGLPRSIGRIWQGVRRISGQISDKRLPMKLAQTGVYPATGPRRYSNALIGQTFPR